jgi:hypothetical protein
MRYRDEMITRQVLVKIGKHDDRVGTASAIAFARGLNADLVLTDADGHDVFDSEDGSTTQWLLNAGPQ